MRLAVRRTLAGRLAGALLALGLAAPVLAQDDATAGDAATGEPESGTQFAELRARIDGLERERIERLLEALLTENGCTLSMVDEEATDRKIIAHFAAALELDEDEAFAVSDRLRDRISPVSRAMVEEGRIVADVERGVVWLRDCTTAAPDLSGPGPLETIPASYSLPGAGAVPTEEIVALIEDHFETGGCTLDFSDPEAGRQGIIDTVAAGIGLAEADRADARPALDGAMKDIFGVLVPAGKVIVDEAAMTVSLADCNG
ncbi:hypothetical protein P1J78_00630 [Psychromarinibacter sp. C21-152]|uniref:Uncharacterized protein n=1 Tax=Psychromarinibacter sediminicola TaxID=3033385 RepID=A0AAE3NJY7_9RHOB|nr:hypothetical protein [Psychromarinibacter sediminicola]MDF0599223.1 hypothetical protein [Psychromarinibacter sediminicola]